MPIPRHTAAVPALIAALVLLSACTPGTPDDDDTPSASPSISATPSASPTPDPTVGPTTDPVPADMKANIVDAMNSGNTAALEGYLAPTVHITYAATEDEGDVSDPVLIINNLTNFVDGFPTWDFNLPASLVDQYANDPDTYPSYADDFPPGAFVGKASNDKVISFVISGGQITRIFFAVDEYVLTFD
jgi:hypothetical protein